MEDKEFFESLSRVIDACAKAYRLDKLETVISGLNKSNKSSCLYEIKKCSFNSHRYLENKVSVFLDYFKNAASSGVCDYFDPIQVRSKDKVTLSWSNEDRELVVSITLKSITQNTPCLPKGLYHEKDMFNVWNWLHNWES